MRQIVTKTFGRPITIELLEKLQLPPSNSNNNVFELPSFDNRNVDVKLLPLAWSTSNIPDNDKFCDAENCLSSNSSNITLKPNGPAARFMT